MDCNLSGIRLEALADVLLDFSTLEDLINCLDQPEQSAKGAIIIYIEVKFCKEP
jgi:hypothetical protein